MSIFENYEIYKDEIELIRSQNRVECDLYSIIVSIIRERKYGRNISLRDVTTRRRTNLSKRFYGESGFPDFIVLARDKNQNAAILGAIEVKYIDKIIDNMKYSEQLIGHLNSFKKVIFTNGIIWQYYELDYYRREKKYRFEVKLGEINKKNEIEWESDKRWIDLLKLLDEISW